MCVQTKQQQVINSNTEQKCTVACFILSQCSCLKDS